jgi:Right handed beta helix region
MLEVKVASRMILVCGLLIVCVPAAFSKDLCVNPAGSNGCYSKINSATTAASSYDVIHVAAGTYQEQVTISRPLSLLGAGPENTIIDATNQPNGILIDGYDNAGLHDVIVTGFTVKNALYEGVLILSTDDAVIRDNHIVHNDTISHTFGSGTACQGQPAYETDESGDCGGGLHLIGATGAVVSGNLLTGNADGILISDETGEARDNLINHNIITDNPEECGLVLASHPPVGATPPNFAPHNGVNHNTLSENVVSRNGVSVGGAGAGLFSDGEGQGRVSGNIIIGNQLTANGIPGVALHSHVGPAFGLPADDFSGNMIIGNFIARNGADTDDTATPGTAGINISAGGGGSPIYGTIISGNVIRDEDIAVAVNAPNEVDIHVNDLLGGKIGVADVCAFDGSSACTGSIDATENYWGCGSGPGASGCSTVSGTKIRATPSLSKPTSDVNGNK